MCYTLALSFCWGAIVPDVLIACEESGVLRDCLLARGVDAISCDLLPSRRPGPHLMGDVRPHLRRKWHTVIAFPPCTHLAVSGARWFPEKRADGRQAAAVAFFMRCVNACATRVAVENPVGIMSTCYRKPDQIIQPWQHGDGEVKATCLWLQGLPLLAPSNIVPGRTARVWRMPPGPDRERERSKTFQGIADAIARQWF